MSSASRSSKRCISPIAISTFISFLLPRLDLFDQLTDFPVYEHESLSSTHCRGAFFRIVECEHRTERWLCRAFQHVLAFFVEACCDRIVLLENNQKRGHWRSIVV